MSKKVINTITIIKNGSSAPKGGTPEDSEVDLLFSF